LPILLWDYGAGVLLSPALAGALCGVVGASLGASALSADAPGADDALDLAAADGFQAAISGAAACILGTLVTAVGGGIHVFGAVSAKSIDPSQKATIMEAALDEIGQLTFTNAAMLLPLAIGAVLILTAGSRAGTVLRKSAATLIVALLVATLSAVLLWPTVGGGLERFANVLRT
jgi:hypothetical protein